jgi:hypothetical protein
MVLHEGLSSQDVPFSSQHVKVRACISAQQLRRFVFLKLRDNLLQLQSQSAVDLRVEDVILFVIDKKNERWSFDGGFRICDLLINDIWSLRAVSEDQEAARVVTSRLKQRDMERIYFIVKKRQGNQQTV